MKTRLSTGYLKRAAGILLLCSVGTIGMASAVFAFTAPNSITACYDCHGSPVIPGGNDIRPVDSTYRNISTGGVVGNHRSHLPAATTLASVCTPCHGPAQTAMDHRDGKINMRQHINSSATTRGVYNKGIFINQTSAFNATSATCSSVNCHFQKTTLQWGSPTYSYSSASVNDCDQCHGNGTLSAPQDGSHPNTTNKHGLYYGSDALSCAKCHADHTVEAIKFAHATSAGNRALILNGTNIASTNYSKAATNLVYPTYMTNAPANRNGTCNNLYCHSPGTGATKQTDGRGVVATAVAITWGGTADCSSCHTGGTTTGPTYPNNAPKANAHNSHTKVNVAYTCDVCHFKTTSNGTTIASMPRHVDGYYNISANTTKTKQFNYTFAATGGTCSNSSCHGSAKPTWNLVFAPTSGNTCQKCHGSQTAAFTTVSGASIAPGTNNMDTSRNTGVTVRGGMHQEHMAASSGITGPIHCGECHVVVNNVKDATHMQNTTARPAFGPIAKAKSHSPTVTRTAGVMTCNNTYCHTGNLNSGTAMAPAWNNTGYISANPPVLADCNRCHGLPPRKTFGHPTSAVATTPALVASLCSGCHSATLNSTATTFVNVFKDKNLHMNGDPNATSHAFPYPGGSPQHMVDAGTTPWGACNTCHNATATGYTYAAWATATTGHLSQTAPNCTVCHVSGLKVASGTSSCWDCHGSSATNGSPNGNAFPNYSGSHTKHAAGYKVMACSECHSNGGAGTQNHGSKAAVASTGIAFVNVTSTTKAFHFTATGKGVCSNAYCHSTVQSATGAAAGTFVNPTWGSKLACNGCHGNTAATLTTGTHAGHLNAPYTYACTDCHGTAGGAGNTTIHTNGAVNVDLTNRGGSAVSYTGDTIPGNAAFTGTCNTTTCHGQKSPVWGSTASSQTCTKCHGQANAFNNFSSSVVAPGGLGRDTGGNTASTSPRVGAHQQHLLGSSKMSNPIHCGECHTVHVTVGDPTHLNMTTARIDFGPMAKMNSNYVPNVTRVAGAVNCNNTYCHLGGFRASGAGVSQRGNVTFPTWSFNSSPLDNTTVTGTCTNKCHAMPPSSNGTAGIAGDIHANITTPVTIADIGSKCSSRNDGLAGGGCHPTIKSRNIATGNYTNMTSIFINQGALHVDGIVQGGTCTGCHAATQGNRRSITGQFTSARNSHHYQGPVASLNGTVCYQCHWEANADGSPNSTYHKSGTSGSPVALVVRNTVTTRPAAVSAATLQYYSSGGAAASTRGAIKKIDRQCLGCHDDTNKAIAPFPNDTNTTSAYSWEAMAVAKGGLAGAAQSIAIKFNDIATTPWGKLTGNYTNAKSGQTKAYSAHGNAANNARGWSTLAENAQGAAVANYPNTSGAVNVACYDCHNSHGSESTVPANAVTTSYSSSTGRGRGGILKTTVAGRGGYTVSYRPYTGGNVAQKNVYKTGAGLCFDCHNNATVGLVTSTGFSTPWGYQATFGGTAKIHGYNDNPYFGKTGGAFPKGQTYTYIGTGRPNNMGGHFGASSPLTTATNSNLKIGGLCTPCHDPHGVSPGILAANKQYAVPMLKETFVTSPYKQDAAAVTESHGGGRSVPSYTTAARAGYHIDQNTMQAIVAGAKPATAIKWNFATSANTLQTLTDTQFAGLCLKCHSKTSIGPNAGAAAGAWKSMGRIHNSVKGWAATSGSGNTGNTKHAYTCSKCHSTHNSNLPRLLVTNCLDVTHKGRVTTGGAVNFGPFATSGSRGNGGGQFPGGGARQADGGRSVAPGPWFFGVAGTAPGSQEKCHNTATAGGTTFNAASEQWNTKSIW